MLLVERFRLSAFANRACCEEVGEANCSLCISSVSVVNECFNFFEDRFERTIAHFQLSVCLICGDMGKG